MTDRVTADEVHEYWRKPPPGNALHLYDERYPCNKEASLFLVKLVKQFCPDRTKSIIEIGCGIGRNLDFLRRNRYTRLAGVDINPDAIVYLRKRYWRLKRRGVFHAGDFENYVPVVNAMKFDLLFTMSTFNHTPYDSDDAIRGIVKGIPLLITIEMEQSETQRHFPRDFKAFFEGIGYKQIHETPTGCAKMPKHTARVFRKF